VEVLEAIRTRRSIRRYKQDPIPDELIVKILEAGRWAPSASNSQPWSFVVLTDPEVKRRVTRCFLYGWFLDEAPVGIVVSVDPRLSSCPIQDGSLAVQNMMLAAHALGLGTCWINPGLNDNEVKKILGIPRGHSLICVLSLGHPAEAPSKLRKKLRDIAFSGRWGNSIEPDK
jgi:nitroreductase